MRRRDFITLIGGAAAGWPVAARAQQSERMRRIAVLLPATTDDPQYQTWFGAFLQVRVPASEVLHEAQMELVRTHPY